MSDFLTLAILDCILPPYAPNPRCLVVSYGLFRVSTVKKYNQNLGTSMGHAPKDSLLEAIFSYFWLNMSTILDFGALEMRYDQINVRNGFLMLKLVKNEFLITLIAQKLRILKMPDFLMAAILDCILPPYAPDPICPPDSKLLFRVHTTINHHKILRDKPCKRGQLLGTLLSGPI